MDDSFSTGSTKLNPTPTTTTTTTTTTATTTTTIDNQNGNNNNNNDSHQFQSSSPTSVLESSDSYSGEKNISLNADMFVEARARSISPPPVSSSKTKRSSKKMKRNKRRKIDPLLSSPVDQDIVPSIAAVRKCLHCEITKTPQWREGPLGPKTLCNACGVRYKSGRLFPEYRPAASPTFVPELHSNSHKKVLEMRIKS